MRHLRRIIKYASAFIVLPITFMWLTFWLNDYPYGINEDFIYNWMESFRKKHLNKEIDFIEKNFLLLDVAHNAFVGSDLNQKSQSDTSIFNMDRITSRKRLATLFKQLHSIDTSSYKLIVCDIVFEQYNLYNCDENNYDSIIAHYAYELILKQKIVFAGKRGKDGYYMCVLKPRPSDQNIGSTEYFPRHGYFVSSKLIKENSDYTLPFLMYQRILGKTPETERCDKYFLKQIKFSGEDQYYFNSFIPSMSYGDSDIDNLNEHMVGGSDKSYNIMNLKNVTIDTLALKSIVESKDIYFKKNGIIFIGNIKDSLMDRHVTFWGETSGFLIIANTWNHLINGNNAFKPEMLIIIYIFYSFIFTIIFFSTSISILTNKLKVKIKTLWKLKWERKESLIIKPDPKSISENNEGTPMATIIMIWHPVKVGIYTLVELIIHFWYLVVLYILTIIIYFGFATLIRFTALSFILLFTYAILKSLIKVEKKFSENFNRKKNKNTFTR